MTIRWSLCLAALALTLASCDRRASPPGDGRNVALAAPQADPGTGRDGVTPRLSVPQVAEILTDAFASAAEAIRPSVVRIDVEVARPQRVATRDDRLPPELRDFLDRFFDFGRGRGPSPSPSPVRGTGSGVVLDRQGHVLTNSHVIARARQVTITLVDGRRFEGEVLGHDPLTDVGVVRFSRRPADLTLARLGDAGQLRVGQWVLAVGSPLGLDQSVTAGIVSGLGEPGSRIQPLSERVRGYVQTDAAINPGNSGGPLVNLAGEVVGINTVINVGPGGAYGFAIPIQQAADVARVIIREGRVRYPYIGVRLASVSDLPEEARQRLGERLPAQGAVVVEVVPGSPAAEAGLRQGDVITRIAGREVRHAADVVDAISERTIGARLPLEYVRDGRTEKVEITTAEMPTEDTTPEAPRLGLSLQTLTEPLARSLGLSPSLRGAVIADVMPDSPAARAGLRPGEVIVEVDRKPVTSAEAAVSALRADGKGRRLLRVVGPGGSRYVTVTLE